MPIVRDGRNRVDEYETLPPLAIPSGPVERSQASAQRMADFAAERAAAARHDRVSVDPTPKKTPAEYMAASRARGAVRGGFVKGQKKPAPPADVEISPVHVDVAEVAAPAPRGQGGHWAEKRAAKLERVVAAIRATPNLDDAADQLGMAGDALRSLVSQYRVDGTLPADVDELIRGRSNSRPRVAAAAEAPRERPTADRPVDPEVDVASGGAAPAPAEVGASAAAEAPPAVVPGLPCDSCSHAVVCVIRPELEAWVASLPRPVSQLAAITVVEARLELACSHYLLAVPA